MKSRIEAPFIVKSQEELMEIARSHLTSHVVPKYRNFFIEQEISKRQGLNSEISRENLTQTRSNLIKGFAYIKQYAISVDDGFLLEEAHYADLKNSKLGIARNEAILFESITTSLTIQHASPTNTPYGTALKSIRQREITGETVEFKRTSVAMGRQNFVYFVTGVGEQVNAPGLHELTTYQIDLNKLALHNPQKFAQLYVSPHLSEFDTNACAPPHLMGNTRVDIQFDGKNQTITYRFQRSDNCLLEKTYRLHDFVFYGGNDVLSGIALRFIELLRFVGNPYRQILLARLADPVLSKQEKLQQLSTVMTALMPGSMVIEAKIPQEIKLNDTYTKITTPEIKADEKDPDSFHHLNDDVYHYGRNLYFKTDTTESPFVEYLKKYADEFMSHAGINRSDREENKQEEFASLINNIITQVCFSGPYSYDMPNFSGHIPTDLNLFAFKLIYSKHELSLPLIEWLLSTKFVSPDDNQLHYLFNINQRESSGTYDLFLALLSVRYKQEKHEQLLGIFFPLLNEKLVQLNFCHYVVIAAHESFGKISDSKEVAFLLEKNIPITDETNPHLINWISFANNKKLLEYLFIGQSLNINAIVHEYSWLEHAILNKNEAAAHWLIDHGAVLERQHPEIMNVMPKSVSSRLGLVTDEADCDYQPKEPIYKDAVVIVVTSRYHNGDLYTIMGRRRVNNKLEDQWSFPGGIIEFGETPVEAAVRELSEETTAMIDAEKASVRELMRVKLNEEHQNENNIGNLVFVHIDLGKTLLPSVWPDDDLGEVTKVRIHQNMEGQLLRDHKNLPIRASNVLLFDCLKAQELHIQPHEFSLLLFAEMYPVKFMGYYMRLLKNIEEELSGDNSSYFTYLEVEPIKNDEPSLILLKNNTINQIKNCLKQISPAINDPEIKESILISVINSGDFPLLQFLLDNGYPLNSLRKNASCRLIDLIRKEQWEMLRFICEQAPHMVHVCKRDWKEVSKLSRAIPSGEIRDHINGSNVDNIIYDTLMYLFKKQTKESLEQRELTLNTVKDIVRKHPEVMEKLTEDHVKLILLSGNVELFKNCYQLSQFEKPLFNSCYFYDFYVSLPYMRINILEYLFDNKHTEMLSFLFKKFPDAFKWDNSAYIPYGKKETDRYAKKTSRVSYGIFEDEEAIFATNSNAYSELDEESSKLSVVFK